MSGSGLRVRFVFNGIGESVIELRTAFEEAVDDYFEICSKIGKSPQKSYSGRLMLRIPSQIYGAIAQAAEASGKSINPWATEMLEKGACSQ